MCARSVEHTQFFPIIHPHIHPRTKEATMQPKKVIGALALVLVAIGLIAGALWFLPKEAESTAPEPAASTAATPSDEESVDPVIQDFKDSFVARDTAYEVLLRSFDYREPDSVRHERLAQYMLPEALDAVIQTDLDAAHIRDKMRDPKIKAMKVAKVTSTPVTDLDEDIVVVETEVTISSTQADDPATYTDVLISTTTWVKVEGTWMVSEVDPYE